MQEAFLLFILITHCWLTNCCKFNGLIQQGFIIPQYLWVRNSVAACLGGSHSGIHEIATRVLVVFIWRHDEAGGSTSKMDLCWLLAGSLSSLSSRPFCGGLDLTTQAMAFAGTSDSERGRSQGSNHHFHLTCWEQFTRFLAPTQGEGN